MPVQDRGPEIYQLIIDRLRELETSLVNPSGDEWRINGLDTWPIVRSHLLARTERNLITHACRLGVERAVPRPGVQSYRRLRDLGVMVRGNMRQAASSHITLPSSDILCVNNSFGAARYGEVSFHQEIVPIAAALSRSGADVETVDLVSTLPGYQFTPLSPSVNLRSQVDCVLRSAAYPNVWFSRLKDVLQSFPLSLKPRLDVCMIQLRRSVAETLALRDAFQNGLAAIRPKCVLTSNYYNAAGWALCAACHELGILCVDIQHGHQGTYHHAYGGAGAYSRLNTMPGAFFTWTDNEHASLPMSAKRLTVGPGSFRSALSVLDETPSPSWNKDAHAHSRRALQAALDEADTRFGGEGAPAVTLLVSQGDASKAKMEAYAKHCALPLIRPHPAEEVVREGFAGAPLAAVLAASDYIVSGYSSIAIEGALLGKTPVFSSAAGPLMMRYVLPTDPIIVSQASELADLPQRRPPQSLTAQQQLQTAMSQVPSDAAIASWISANA